TGTFSRRWKTPPGGWRATRRRNAMRATTADAPPFTTIGRDVPRIDARAKATGEALYAGDLRLPGMTYGRLLRSPYAHARIVGIDTSRAEAMPGVVAVLTGADVHDIDPRYGHALKDRPLIAIDRVRFVGEPVVAVAAESLAIADAALAAIEVEYEELPAVVTVEAALADDAVHLHDVTQLRPGLFHGLGEIDLKPGNICYHHHFARGDVDRL